MEYNLDMIKPFEVFEFKAVGVEFTALQPSIDEFTGLYVFGWYETKGVPMHFASKFDGLDEILAWLVEQMNSTPIQPEKPAVDGEQIEYMLGIIMARCKRSVTRGTDVVHVIQMALDRMWTHGQFPDDAALEAWDEHFGSGLSTDSP